MAQHRYYLKEVKEYNAKHKTNYSSLQELTQGLAESHSLADIERELGLGSCVLYQAHKIHGGLMPDGDAKKGINYYHDTWRRFSRLGYKTLSEACVDMYENKGMSSPAIGGMLDRSANSVVSVLRKAGVKIRRRGGRQYEGGILKCK